MENVITIPAFMIKRYTELAGLLVLLMATLYVIKIVIPSLFYNKIYKAIMIMNITAFMVVNITVEVMKIYDRYTYEGDLEFRIIYIVSTILLSIFFYYIELKK